MGSGGRQLEGVFVLHAEGREVHEEVVLVRELEAYLFYLFDGFQDGGRGLVGEVLDGLALQLREDAQDGLPYRVVDPGVVYPGGRDFSLCRDAGGEHAVPRLGESRELVPEEVGEGRVRGLQD